MKITYKQLRSLINEEYEKIDLDDNISELGDGLEDIKDPEERMYEIAFQCLSKLSHIQYFLKTENSAMPKPSKRIANVIQSLEVPLNKLDAYRHAYSLKGRAGLRNKH